MSNENLLLLAIAIPALTPFLLALFGKLPNLRDAVSVVASIATFAAVLHLLLAVIDGARPAISLLEVMPGLVLGFEIEPLGMLFATVASGLWIPTSLYSIGYMRGAHEKKQTRFAICFAIAIAAAVGIAFSGNLFTLFIFYEVLTISTYPLVAHKETPEAKKGARTYLAILMTTSILFLLVALIWTWNITGTTEFRAGGILEGHIDPALVPFLLALFAFGIGKAALMPFHRWLPAAMVAPTPVSALLHAVAVVKAGVFTMLKVGTYIFGVGFLSKTGAADWLMWLAAASILIASIVAITKDDLKARLAYSTVSQLSYITLGVALATQMGVVGGAMHIVTHAFGKIALFMCAGAIYVAAHKTKISQLDGLGRKMPITFFCFTIAALSIIGLPPFAGAWSKWYLMIAAAETSHLIIIGVLMVSSLLNVAYLLPIPARAFFLKSKDDDANGKIEEAPLFCLLPICFAALGCVVIFFTIGGLYEYLLNIPILPESQP
jgi:multicomponent Na+:H+ antiporter subunit D